MSTVLVVDDEPDMLLLTSTVLEGAGHEVVTAPSAEDAIDLLGSADPDIVLLDLRMPGIGGWGVIEYLQQDERMAILPVVIVSAHAHDEHVERALAAGCRGHLAKPFLTRELLEVVDAFAA